VRALRGRLGDLAVGLPPGGRDLAAHAPAPAKEEGERMPEVVRPRDGDPVTLGPCPPWCTLGRHFADGEPVDAGDGYHHAGTEAEVPTAYPFGGLTDAEPTIVRAALKSWAHPLGAGPGPARVELNLGTPAARTDLCVEAAPAGARAIARALLDLAGTAERAGEPAGAATGQEPGGAQEGQ